MERIDIDALWRYLTRQVTAQVTSPELWRAMEAAKPIALDEDELVVGFSRENRLQKTVLLDERNRRTVEQVLFAAARRPIQLRVVCEDTQVCFEAASVAEAWAAVLDTWDSVAEGVQSRVQWPPSVEVRLERTRRLVLELQRELSAVFAVVARPRPTPCQSEDRLEDERTDRRAAAGRGERGSDAGAW